MPKASTDPTKGMAVLHLSKDARGLMKMFAFRNDVNNGDIVEHALKELYKRNTDYTLALDVPVQPPATRGRGKQQAAE